MPRPVLFGLAVLLILGGGVAAHEDHSHEAHADEAAAHDDDHGHEDDHAHDDDHDHADDDHDHAHDDHDHDHVHGQASIDVELAGDLIEVTLFMPGEALFGEDVAHADMTVSDAAVLLESSDLGIAIPDAAGCRVLTFDVDLTEVSTDGHDGHRDVTAERLMMCDAPEAFDRLTVTAFAQFAGIETVRLDAERDGFEIEAELTAETPVLPFAPLSN